MRFTEVDFEILWCEVGNGVCSSGGRFVDLRDWEDVLWFVAYEARVGFC